jgi:glycosyltransferase involved in cell wall biosynthesis
VTALSEYQWAEYPHLRPAAVIHHGIDPSQFTFRPEAEDYLCYLGRFTPGKGPLAAIDAARVLGMPLVLAGPANPYFAEHVAPHVDGTHVRHVGQVDAAARDRLLGGARALLYPINEPEPFGLVMIESMMCGTPVAAIGIGAVPEVVEPGVTGAWTDSPEGFTAAVREALDLNRQRVRRRALERFTAERMTADYVAVYERACAAAAQR